MMSYSEWNYVLLARMNIIYWKRFPKIQIDIKKVMQYKLLEQFAVLSRYWWNFLIIKYYNINRKDAFRNLGFVILLFKYVNEIYFQ